jgi:cell division septum initiation protein DivIVA
MSADPTTDELERLRRRVDELERELAERTAAAEAAVAAAQDRSYWVDRLPLDLNALMEWRLARLAFGGLLGLAAVARAVKRWLSR